MKVDGDTMILIPHDGRQYKLLIQSMEKLIVTEEIKLGEGELALLRDSSVFYCTTRLYPAGNPRFSGAWTREGTRTGVWIWYDDSGAVEKTVEY
jgi:hypothetical protein